MNKILLKVKKVDTRAMVSCFVWDLFSTLNITHKRVNLMDFLRVKSQSDFWNLIPWERFQGTRKMICGSRCFSANIYLLKVDNRNTRKMCDICSKLTIKTPERGH